MRPVEKAAFGRSPTLEEFQALADRFVPDGCRLFDPRWLSEFRGHHRRRSHSESYSAERVFVGREVLKLSDQTHKIWAQFGTLAETIRTPMCRFFSTFFAHHTEKLEDAVQIRIHYPPDPFVEHRGHPDGVHLAFPSVVAGRRAVNGPLYCSPDGVPIPGGFTSLFDGLSLQLFIFGGAHPPAARADAVRAILDTLAPYADRVSAFLIHGGQDPAIYEGLQIPTYLDPTLHLHYLYAAQQGGLFLRRLFGC